MKKQAAGACLLLFDSRCFRTNHTKNFCCITESVCFQFVIVHQSTLFDALTGSICKIINEELDVPYDKIYVKYEEVEYWGWNGRNF